MLCQKQGYSFDKPWQSELWPLSLLSADLGIPADRSMQNIEELEEDREEMR